MIIPLDSFINSIYSNFNSSIKALVRSRRKISGCNNTGRIVSYHRAGGYKRNYRLIDYARKLYDIPACFLKYTLDPNRKSLIALILYSNGFLSFILGAKNLTSENFIISTYTSCTNIASHLLLSNMLIGIQIHNLEFKPIGGGKAIRAGGCWGQLLRKKQNFAYIKMPSGEIRKIKLLCFSSIGPLEYRIPFTLKKAGHNRSLGLKPIVRGVAMNPIDHPLGGGEGKSSGGRASVSPWGILTKGHWKTRSKKRSQSYLLRDKLFVKKRKKK